MDAPELFRAVPFRFRIGDDCAAVDGTSSSAHIPHTPEPEPVVNVPDRVCEPGVVVARDMNTVSTVACVIEALTVPDVGVKTLGTLPPNIQAPTTRELGAIVVRLTVAVLLLFVVAFAKLVKAPTPVNVPPLMVYREPEGVTDTAVAVFVADKQNQHLLKPQLVNDPPSCT